MTSDWVSQYESRTAKYLKRDLELPRPEREALTSLLASLPAKIVDAHVHTSRARDLTEPLSPAIEGHMMSTYVDYGLDASDRRRRILGLPPAWSSIRFGHVFPTLDRRAANRYLLSEKSSRDAVVALGILDDTDYTLNLVGRPDVVGLKMYPSDAAGTERRITDYFPEAWLEHLDRLRKPIVLHLPAPLPETVEQVIDIAQRYPRLPVVLAHVGLNHIVSDEGVRSLTQVRPAPNIFVDTARVDDTEVLTAAIEILSDARVIFGSDEPLDTLRSVVYVHPSRGKRIATDRRYHWSSEEEHREFGSIARHREMSLISQLSSLKQAARLTGANYTRLFSDNARSVFGLS